MIRKLSRSHSNVIGFEASGTVTEDQFQQMYGEMRQLIDRHGSIRVLSRVRDMPGMELSAINERIQFAREHLDDIEKAAVVTDTRSGEWMTKVTDKLTGVDVRQFSVEDEHQAWEWLDT